MAWQYSELYENQRKSEVALKAAAYQKIEYYGEGRVAFLQITREEMEAVGATDDDLESFAPFLRCIEEVSAFLSSQEKLRVSFGSVFALTIIATWRP